jgi:hypothetical protein
MNYLFIIIQSVKTLFISMVILFRFNFFNFCNLGLVELIIEFVNTNHLSNLQLTICSIDSASHLLSKSYFLISKKRFEPLFLFQVALLPSKFKGIPNFIKEMIILKYRMVGLFQSVNLVSVIL